MVNQLLLQNGRHGKGVHLLLAKPAGQPAHAETKTRNIKHSTLQLSAATAPAMCQP